MQKENQDIMRRKKLKIALYSIVAFLVIVFLLPTKIQNSVEVG